MKALEITQLPLPNGETIYCVSVTGEDIDEPIIIGFPTEARAREFIALARSGASTDVLVEFIQGNTMQ
jgi:hypothetical protein